MYECIVTSTVSPLDACMVMSLTGGAAGEAITINESTTTYTYTHTHVHNIQTGGC